MHRKLFSLSFGVALVRLAGVVLSFLVTLMIGRTFGAEGLGIYGSAVIIVALLAVPVGNGWASLVLRRTAAAEHDGQWGEVRGLLLRGVHLALIVTILAFMVGASLAWAGNDAVSAAGGLATAALLAGVLLCDQLAALRLAALRGINHPVWGQVPEVVLRPALVVVGVLAIPLLVPRMPPAHYAFVALAGAAAVSAIVGGIVWWRKAPREVSDATPIYQSREWFAAGALLAGNSGMVLLNAYLDVLVLGALGSMEQVGIYRVAVQVALFSGFAYTSINMLATQQFASRFAKGDREGVQRTATAMSRLAFLGALPLPAIFWYWGEDLLLLTFGEGFLPALAPMFILFLSQAVNSAMGMASSLLIAARKERVLIRLAAVALAVNLAGGLLLVPRLDAIGAAIAATIAVMLWNGLLWHVAKRETGIDSSILGFSDRQGG